MHVQAPDREPDVILPESDLYCEVKIWVKENVFFYKGLYRTSVQHMSRTYDDALKYLEYSVQTGDARGKVALDFLAEWELLQDE